MTPEELRDRAQRFAVDVDTFCDSLPKDSRTQQIANQLHDAAHSAAMNYRAACRARSTKEFISKLCITVEEADEAQGWLEVLVKSKKASGQEVQRLLKESTELLKIFAASRRTVVRNAETRKRARHRHHQSPNH
jgi:four helix bundle protein